MKILLVNKFHYHKGGSETYYFALAEALKAKGHDIIFFSMKDSKNVDSPQREYFVNNTDYNTETSKPTMIKDGMKLIYSNEAKKKFEKLILKEKPDIVHLNLVHRQITLSILDVTQKYKIPVVFTMHDLICVCPNYTMLSPDGICEKCLRGRYKSCIQQKCIKNSKSKSLLAVIEANFYQIKHCYDKIDLYIAPSAFYQKKLEQGHFTRSPIKYYKNFLPMHTTYRIAGDVEDYFLFFGRLSKEKGIITLVKAVEQSCQQIRLRIAGDGPQREEIQTYIKTHHLENRIKMLGFQTGESLKEIIDKAKAIVVPSEWYENAPYSVMEAMASGKPIIASEIGGLPELVENGVTGYVFPAGDICALIQCVEKINNLTEQDYQRMSIKALEYAKESFVWKNYVEHMEKEYTELINLKRVLR